jgi:glycosyltransferase involved in cell wall biosynthesis
VRRTLTEWRARRQTRLAASPGARPESPARQKATSLDNHEKTGVLFVNTPTQAPLGADIWVHAQLMKQLDRSRYELYAACATGSLDAPTPTFALFRTIPDMEVRPVDFGTELNGPSPRAKLRNLLSALRAARSLVQLARFIRRKHVAILHTTDRPRDAFACVLLSRVTRARCIVHVHVGYADWMSPLRKWSIRHADVLVTVSEFVKETLISSGHDSTRIHTVLNGIEVENWDPTLGGDDMRDEFKLSPHTPVVISVCRLFPSKGPGDLIRVMPSLVDEWPDIRLFIVGAEMAAGYRSELERLSRDLLVAENVIFTGRRPDVARLMAGADVFAMPSIGEPCALVYLEAMAMGLPIVALDSGGTPELVEHENTGLLSNPGDVERLAAHLRSLLQSQELRASMGSRGRERLEKHFASERMARDLEFVYEGMTS